MSKRKKEDFDTINTSQNVEKNEPNIQTPYSLPARTSTPIDFPRSEIFKNSGTFSVLHSSAIQVGISNFFMLVQKNSFVDKTMFIKDFIESGEAVMLITSPRRFGKSTNMNMIKTFLEIEVDHKGNKKIINDRVNYNLFTNQLKDKLQISNHKKFIEQYLGQYPVIFVSFAAVQGKNYEEVLNGVKSAISRTFKQHDYIINVLYDIVKNANITHLEKIKAQDFLNGYEKIYYDNAQNTTKEDIIDSLRFLSEILYNHFQKKVCVLVDEYDTPIDTIIRRGPAEDIVTVNDLIDVVLGTVLKDNDYLESGLMTGISVIAKNSGSTKLNNVTVHRFLGQHKYVKYYGFTNEEVSMLLDTDSLIEALRTKTYNGLSISEAKPIIKEEVKSFYNGYLAINTDLQIYNPWSIMQCLKQGEITNYWTHTGSIEEIRELFQLSDVRKKFELLVQDEGIPVHFQEKPTISDIQILQNLLYCQDKDIKQSHINLFFSYIFELGYLTPIKQENQSTLTSIKHYKIPNKEIIQEFTRYAIDYYVNNYKLSMDNFFCVVQALKSIIKNYDNKNNLELKVNNFKVELQKLFQSLDFSKIESPIDGDHPNESLLHTIVGCIVIQSNTSKFGSEVSYNTGMDKRRPDIVASYKELGIIIELKFNANADIALTQIKERNYNNFFSTTKNIKYILDIGINLSNNKEIEVKHELQPNNTNSGQGILSVCDLDYLTYHESWNKYYSNGIKKILELRIKELFIDIKDKVLILSDTKYQFTQDNVGTKQILQDIVLLNPKVKEVVLLPYNIDNKHWTGLMITKDYGDSFYIKYIDPENNTIPQELSLALQSEANNLCITVNISQIIVAQQKYNNCGPEVIENFILLLTGSRLTQEEAVPFHSQLVENNLLANTYSDNYSTEVLGSDTL
ncbi:ATPase AAA [Trichonephila clavata]|uniref:ATPase AAA n=1 Tax=Trichonephila clavata TaxID=2740835 RepID=A0A8X6H796_TRICU|nr:ATPase AAA [Trichonephila clavata]